MLKHIICLIVLNSANATSIQEEVTEKEEVHWYRLPYTPIEKVLFIPLRFNSEKEIYETITDGTPLPVFQKMNSLNLIRPHTEDDSSNAR